MILRARGQGIAGAALGAEKTCIMKYVKIDKMGLSLIRKWRYKELDRFSIQFIGTFWLNVDEIYPISCVFTLNYHSNNAVMLKWMKFNPSLSGVLFPLPSTFGQT